MTIDPDRFAKALHEAVQITAPMRGTWALLDEGLRDHFRTLAAAVLALSRAEAGDALLAAVTRANEAEARNAALRKEMGYQPGLRTLLARLHTAAKRAVEGATVHSELPDYCVECDVFNELDQAVVAVDAAMAAALKGEKLPP